MTAAQHDEPTSIARESITSFANTAFHMVRKACRSDWEAREYLRIAACRSAGSDHYADVIKKHQGYQDASFTRCPPGKKCALSEDPQYANVDSKHLPHEANLAILLNNQLVVLDLDTGDWPGVILEIAEDFKEIVNAPRVITPHGAHVYFRIVRRKPGRWKHSSYPCSLLANGHAVAPGSIVDGKMYIPDPTQDLEYALRVFSPGRLPQLNAAPGGDGNWPGFDYELDHGAS